MAEFEDAAAARLDAAITEAVAGRAAPGTDPVVLWLAASLRSEPSPELRRRVAAAVRPPAPAGWRTRLLPLAAAAMAATYLAHGVSAIFLGRWIAAGLGEAYESHPYIELGAAMLFVATVVAAGVVNRRFMPLSVGAGAPFGLTMLSPAVHHLAVFPMGALFHGLEVALAVALLAVWWLDRRYRRRGRREERA